jgi:hypothetical protein
MPDLRTIQGHECPHRIGGQMWPLEAVLVEIIFGRVGRARTEC